MVGDKSDHPFNQITKEIILNKVSFKIAYFAWSRWPQKDQTLPYDSTGTQHAITISSSVIVKPCSIYSLIKAISTRSTYSILPKTPDAINIPCTIVVQFYIREKHQPVANCKCIYASRNFVSIMFTARLWFRKESRITRKCMSILILFLQVNCTNQPKI
jgi:hypothetical protein